MNKTILFTAITVAVIIITGYYLIQSNPSVKMQAEKYGLIDKDQPAPVSPVHNSVYVDFDPSGSGNTVYSVPHLDTSYINNIIQKIQSNGDGDLWLSFVDMDASNNNVLHLYIPQAIAKLETPVRESGERKGDYDKRLATFERDSITNAQQIAQSEKLFEEEKEKFIAAAQVMIVTEYAPKKRGNDFSDCIGSVNAALRSLQTAPHDSLHFRSILFISDGVQDVPGKNNTRVLDSIPADILITVVNHSGSDKNILKAHCIEIDNLDRAPQYIIHSLKPINQ